MSDEKKIKKIDDPFELLIRASEIGKKSKDIVLSNDFEITLQTLNSEDEMNVFAYSENFEGGKFLTRHKIETLVYAIVKVNKKDLREYEKEEDLEKRKKLKEEVLTKVRAIVSTWRDELISFVYSEFGELTDESEKEMIKMGIMKEIPVDKIVEGTEQKTEEKVENKPEAEKSEDKKETIVK